MARCSCSSARTKQRDAAGLLNKVLGQGVVGGREEDAGHGDGGGGLLQIGKRGECGEEVGEASGGEAMRPRGLQGVASLSSPGGNGEVVGDDRRARLGRLPL